MTAQEVLKKYFGYDNFKINQKEAIETLLNGNDLLALLPTGGGKSICYQIPALMSDKVTIIISPLISLMQDQILKLKEVGANCAFINSSLSRKEYYEVINQIVKSEIKIIYVAPERLMNYEFLEITKKLDIGMVIVDEAHCISQWGNDFRPAYLDIKRFVNFLKYRPIIGAFTATATPLVIEDIVNLLGLKSEKRIIGSFDRPNLFFAKYNKREHEKREYLKEYFDNHKGMSGIVYCSTRKTVEECYEYYLSLGYKVGKYHAGMEDIDRKENQNKFKYDEIDVIFATNAFGMGIDKSNVSFVIHYNTPKDLESYYQEAGRAGRDGSYAECILLNGYRDYQTNKLLLSKTYRENTNYDTKEEVYIQKLKNLDMMNIYANSSSCLRHSILKYFNEDSPIKCGNCSSCIKIVKNVVNEDVTLEAHKILAFTNENSNYVGKMTVISALRGSDNEKVHRLHLTKSKFYGSLKECKKDKIIKIFDQLISEGYIDTIVNMYPLVSINQKGQEALINNEKFYIKVIEEEVKIKKDDKSLNKGKNELYNRLRKLRKEIADEKGVPAFVIFNDKHLEDMAIKVPTTLREFLRVNGVGETKCKYYGPRFIEVINEYLKEKNQMISSKKVIQDKINEFLVKNDIEVIMKDKK